MDCPECGTWNPDDKVRCWRCNAQLPSLPEPRKRRARGTRSNSAQVWIWVMAVLLLVVMTLIQCAVLRRGGEGGVGRLWMQGSVHVGSLSCSYFGR